MSSAINLFNLYELQIRNSKNADQLHNIYVFIGKEN